MSVQKTGSVSFALSVAVILVSACGSETKPATQSEDRFVRCEGINTCKGTSECASADGSSGCQGHNECAGKGWISVPETACRDRGGKVLAAGDAASADARGTSVDAPEQVSLLAADAASGEASGEAGDAAMVKCEGINACQGKSECAAADGSSSCSGHNGCAGKGWITVPHSEECTARGGKVLS